MNGTAGPSGEVSDPELDDPLEVVPFTGQLDATVELPGSKSITNRALICAAMAHGATELQGVLFADDTEAMLGCLHELGVELRVDRARRVVRVTGTGGGPDRGALLDARLSGTTARFVLPFAALGTHTVVLDGEAPLRARPMGDLIGALQQLGAELEPLGEPAHLPVRVEGRGLQGGSVSVRGDVSSQFLSGLLLSGPGMRDGLVVEVSTELVSVPYVEMTLSVMGEFGARIDRPHPRRFEVHPGAAPAPERYGIEPDASAASYFFAAAALLGGRVRVEGLGSSSLQGDLAFVDALERMGASVERGQHHTVVQGPEQLRGIDIDMADLSDTAQTLAAVAVFASSPTTISGIGFIRHKETDRIAAVVQELRRCGIDAEELPDGLRVHPGEVRPAVVQTYRDHRMAMSFSLLGLRAEGVRIADPRCVEKTFPDYWRTFEGLRG